MTATRATEIVASSSSAAEDRNERRRVAIVASRCRSLTARTVATWRGPSVGDERRKAAHDVEEVAGEPWERGPATVGRLRGRLADEGGEERQQRQGQHDDHGARPVDDEQRRRWRGPARRPRSRASAGSGRHTARRPPCPRSRARRPRPGRGPRPRRVPHGPAARPQRRRHRHAGPRRHPLRHGREHRPHREEPSSHARGVDRSAPSTTATTTADSAKAVAIVARPLAMPVAARTATGLRAAGTARRSRGSKGFTESVLSCSVGWCRGLGGAGGGLARCVLGNVLGPSGASGRPSTSSSGRSGRSA